MKTEPEEMAAEYRFDYTKAKPNRFAEKMNINVGWTVERFVGEEKISPLQRKKPVAKKALKPVAKTSSSKGKRRSKTTVPR